MGTAIEVDYYTNNKLQDKYSRIIDHTISQYETKYNPYGSKEESLSVQIKQLQPGDKLLLDRDTETIISQALFVSRETDGAFDISIKPLMKLWDYHRKNIKKSPSEKDIANALKSVGYKHISLEKSTLSIAKPVTIDLGGIAKGFIIDAIGKNIKSEGCPDYVVNIGGDLAISGISPQGEKVWNIGIRSPFSKENVIGYFPYSGPAGIATSGNYERYIEIDGELFTHIVDPKTGRPVKNVLSVTVIAENALIADSWATALFVLGPEKSQKILRHHPELHVIYFYQKGATTHFWYHDHLEISFIDESSIFQSDISEKGLIHGTLSR